MAEPAKRRRRAEMTAETTKALIAAARRSFATVGYAATSMDALCADVPCVMMPGGPDRVPSKPRQKVFIRKVTVFEAKPAE